MEPSRKDISLQTNSTSMEEALKTLPRSRYYTGFNDLQNTMKYKEFNMTSEYQGLEVGFGIIICEEKSDVRFRLRVRVRVRVCERRYSLGVAGTYWQPERREYRGTVDSRLFPRKQFVCVCV